VNPDPGEDNRPSAYNFNYRNINQTIKSVFIEVSSVDKHLGAHIDTANASPIHSHNNVAVELSSQEGFRNFAGGLNGIQERPVKQALSH
jgi:hypothetical protein